jgi:hypothetical protein
MSAILVTMPFQVFTDNDGNPLESGYVYIGQENLNPITTPISVYWDEAMTIPAAQPLRTTNGFLSRNGRPSNIFTAQNYSVLVQDRAGVLLYSSLNTPMSITEASLPWVDASAYGPSKNDTTITAAMAYASTAFGASVKYALLIKRGDWTISGNLTIPENVQLIFENGAVLNIATGVTVTYNGPDIQAPFSQIFSLSGTGVFVFGGPVKEVYPQWWGAVSGSVDDQYLPFQNALDSGAKLIFMVSGSYSILKTLILPKGVSLLGAGESSVLDCSSATYSELTSGSHIKIGSLSIVQIADLSSDITKGSTSITFSSAPDVAVGEVLCIYNPADYSYSGFRTYYRAGEFLRVATVSGSTITIQGTLADSYVAADVDVYRIDDMTSGKLSNFKLIGLNDLSNPVFGISVEGALDTSFENIIITECSYACFSMSKSFNASILNCSFQENFKTSASGGEYGLVIGNCHIIKVIGGYYAAYRHGVTTGGGDSVCVVPNRYISIDGAHVTSNNGLQCMDFHGNTEYSCINNSTVDGGFSGGGDFLKISNNIIRTNSSNGQVSMYMSEMRGFNIDISGNTIESNLYATSNTRGSFIDFGGAGDTLSESTYKGGDIRISNNKFVWGVTDSNANGVAIKIVNRGFALTLPISIFITGNSFSMMNDEVGSGGVLVQVIGAGSSPWGMVNISNNNLGPLSVLSLSHVTSTEYSAHNCVVHNNQSNGAYYNGGVLQVVQVRDLISIKSNSLTNGLITPIFASGVSTSNRCKRVHIESNAIFDNFIATTGSSSTNADIACWNAAYAIVQSNASGMFNKFLTCSTNSGFVLEETVTGGTSGATGIIKYLRSTNQIMIGDTITGAFTPAETITGSISGATATVTSESFTTSYRASYVNIDNLWQGQNVGIQTVTDLVSGVTVNTPI